MQNEQKRQKRKKKREKVQFKSRANPSQHAFGSTFFAIAVSPTSKCAIEKDSSQSRDRSRIVVQLILGTRAGLVPHISPLIELVCRKFDISSYLFHSLCLLSFITRFERTEDKKN
uniref:(northern house mosquito) hypothetical protein n=1 Tax=Culex pipiens TaxID=7175 RepID=A0A8D8B9Z6_CULPI